MNTYMRKYFGGVVVGGVCFVLPLFSQAYGVVEQSATRLSDTVVAYTITYDFGFLNAQMWLPIAAVRGEDSAEGAFVGFELQDQVNEPVTAGTTYSIVLGDAMIQGGRYYLPAGKSGEFTLLTLVQTESAAQPALDATALQITSLPHVLQKNGETETLLRQLEATELTKYRTEPLSL